MKAVLSLACVLLFAVSASAETRTWKDKSGKFSIQAELVESDGTAVTLKKADGKVIKVPVDRLSDEDRQFLESQEKNAFSDTEASKKAGAHGGGLRYGWKAGQNYAYSVKIEVNLGEKSLEFTGSPSYTVVSAEPDKTVLNFRGTLMEHERSKSGPMPPMRGPGRMGPQRRGMGPVGPRMHAFSPMTGVGAMGMARTTELTVDSQGNVARRKGPPSFPSSWGTSRT